MLSSGSKENRLTRLVTLVVVLPSVILFAGILRAQTETVSQLQDNFSGDTVWDAATGTLTFASSGVIDFDEAVFRKLDYGGFIWNVPQNVRKIIIDENVRVTGAFHSDFDLDIEGRDRTTSRIYGTDESSWANNRMSSGAFLYSSIAINGATANINTLTIVDPFAFMIRGDAESVVHVDNVNMIDTREGEHNHSDGFVGGDGSTVTNTFFDAGDDAIKPYFGTTTYSNITINMRHNTVPIQFGWFSKSAPIKAVFNNLTITGDWGRGPVGTRPIIGGATKGVSFNATVEINGANIQNPNASIVQLVSSGMTLNGFINDAVIDVMRYSGTAHNAESTDNLVICGTNGKISSYNCTLGGSTATHSSSKSSGGGSNGIVTLMLLALLAAIRKRSIQ